MITNFNELFAELKAKGICKKMVAAWGVDSHTIEAASLASDMGFVKVTLVGDTTGGGGGLPMSSEIPNGWVVRFSSAPMFDADMNHVEFGIAPDIRLDMKDEDVQAGKDTYIESARAFIKDKIVNF